MIFPILAALTLSTSAPALLHDDDPKILDRKPPVPGTGFTAATNAQGLSALTAAASLGFPADNFTLQSWMTLSDLGFSGANGNDCWGYTSPSGREYALMLTTQGTAIVEVSNPTLPTLVETISGPNSTWRDIKVYGSRAYAVSEGGSGIQVIDLTNVDAGVVNLENTVTGPGTNATHNVALDEVSGFLYRTGGGSEGLRIYSLANPSNPQYVGSWSQRYVHDAQIVTYTTGPYAGREIAYCCGGLNGGQTDTGLTIVDVTNKSNPVVLSQVSYPARAYSHQGWLSNDRTRFYLGDELDEGSTVSTTTTPRLRRVRPGQRLLHRRLRQRQRRDRAQHVRAGRDPVPGQLHLRDQGLRPEPEPELPPRGRLLRHRAELQQRLLQRALELLRRLPQRDDHRQRHRVRPVRPALRSARALDRPRAG